jgi:hypothetical protein
MTIDEINGLSDDRLVFLFAEAATKRAWQSLSPEDRAQGDAIRDEVARRGLKGNLQPDAHGNQVWVWSK